MGSTSDVSEQPVDEDWVAQFINSCKYVRNEQMRVLWSRLLAGEVAKPGSFSMRTLGFVRTLSKSDADLFTRFCSTIWDIGADGRSDLRPVAHKGKLKGIPGMELTFEDLLRLDSLGLIKFQPIGDFGLKLSPEMTETTVFPNPFIHQIRSSNSLS
jgi:hypothetical protein